MLGRLCYLPGSPSSPFGLPGVQRALHRVQTWMLFPRF